MRTSTAALGLAAVLLGHALTGCGPAPAGGGAATVASVAEDRHRDARAVVTAPTSRLRAALVRRSRHGLQVAAWWGCVDAGCARRDQAIARSGDDFRSATYDATGPGRASRLFAGTTSRAVPPRPPADAGLDGLLTQDAVSLDRRTVRAVLGGGDGATVLPFQRVARLAAGTWTAYDVPLVDGERGYVSSAVVLPDGRLLALVPTWSGDRPGRPSAVHHGLWVSDDTDWSAWSPWAADPGGVRDLRADPRGGGVLWLVTGDDTAPLVVSTDGGRTVRALRAR